MVRKTGDIVGGQVLENAKLINKLQKSVDMMRKEIAELREVKRSERRRAGEGERENRVEAEKIAESSTQNGKREERKRLEEGSGRKGDFYRANQRQLSSESHDEKRGWRRERLHYH
jgi:phage-related minor tail protein